MVDVATICVGRPQEGRRVLTSLRQT